MIKKNFMKLRKSVFNTHSFFVSPDEDRHTWHMNAVSLFPHYSPVPTLSGSSESQTCLPPHSGWLHGTRIWGINVESCCVALYACSFEGQSGSTNIQKSESILSAVSMLEFESHLLAFSGVTNSTRFTITNRLWNIILAVLDQTKVFHGLLASLDSSQKQIPSPALTREQAYMMPPCMLSKPLTTCWQELPWAGCATYEWALNRSLFH